MGGRVKVLATKSDEWSSSLAIHMVERERQLSLSCFLTDTKVFWQDGSPHSYMCMCVHIHK